LVSILTTDYSKLLQLYVLKAESSLQIANYTVYHTTIQENLT